MAPTATVGVVVGEPDRLGPRLAKCLSCPRRQNEETLDADSVIKQSRSRTGGVGLMRRLCRHPPTARSCR